MFKKEKFLNFIINNGVVGFFDGAITLKSGRKSHWYINWRTISNNVYTLNALVDYVTLFITDKELNYSRFCIYGVPEGATKVGLLTHYKMAMNDMGGNKHISMGRGKSKEHGDLKDKFFIGEPKGNVVVIEDVTTTGGSLIKELNKLEELPGCNVIACIGLTNRMEKNDEGKSVKDLIMDDFGIPYYAMSTAHDLLPKLDIPENVKEEIVKEFDEYGVKPIEL